MNLSLSPLDQLANKARNLLNAERRNDLPVPLTLDSFGSSKRNASRNSSRPSSPISPSSGVFNFSRPHSQQTSYSRRESASSNLSLGDPSKPCCFTYPTCELPRGRVLEARAHYSLQPEIGVSAPELAKPDIRTADMTPEEHVALGIELHEKNSLGSSTYHLRLAAYGRHPVGMLLFGLALRHGWGCSQNQSQAVDWLREAVDTASGNMAMLEDNNGDMTEIRGARTKLALATYELGTSYANGWGVPEDKKAALRAFEMAAQWGDVDAMQEAGFFYAHGIGTKRHLYKSAQLYRKAAALGAPSTGLSWIYKPKYDNSGKEARTSMFRRKS